jgi:integrase
MDRNESVRVTINKTSVEELSVGARIVDNKIDGFLARRLPSGAVIYGFRYRPRGKPQRWVSLGVHGRGHVTADGARREAKKLAGRVAGGQDPYEDDRAKKVSEEHKRQLKKNTVNVVLERYLDEQVREKKLRTEKEIESMFRRHVRPAIGNKPISELSRDDINPMLRSIVKNAGPAARNNVLANLRSALNWYQIEDSNFRNPIVKGMGGKSKARDRTLNDDEIRALWTALKSDKLNSSFTNLVRVLLYTGQRRSDVAKMHTGEIENGNEWIIPAERYKNQGKHYVHLNDKIRGLLPSTKGFVFGTKTSGKKPYSGYSKGKATLDKIIAEQRKQAGLPPLPHWTLHDLRRTARSLMSRAKVSPDIAEMVVGHTLVGVRKVYDRYSYADERKDALQRLSNLLDSIVNPAHDNVVPFEKVDAK